MHSILHPAKEPYLVWLMFESKCYNKLEHCLYFFLSSNSPVINTVRNFLTMAVESQMCSPMIETSPHLFIKFAPIIPVSFEKEGLEVIMNDFKSLYAAGDRGRERRVFKNIGQSG